MWRPLGRWGGDPNTSVLTLPNYDDHTECGAPNSQPNRRDPQR